MADIAGSGSAQIMEIMLPWPPRNLSPNSRVHWAVRSRATKTYRETCHWIALSSGVRIDWEGEIHLWITMYPPDRRRRDDDNVMSSCKGLRDGVADALGVDDSRFRAHPWLSDEVIKGGAVKVRFSRGPDVRHD